MSKIQSSRFLYFPPSYSACYHTGLCKIHAIIASTLYSTPYQIYLYDNTSTAAPVVMVLDLDYNHPVALIYGPTFPIVCNTGLSVTVPANTSMYLVIEW